MARHAEAVAEIVDNLRRIFQAVNEQSKKAERETGLTGPQLWAIKTIAQREPVMVSELARYMYLHPATVVGILDRLEARGYVTRVRSTEDRRVVRVELTDHGSALVGKAPAVAQGLLVAGLERLAGTELTKIAAGLNRMAEILGADKMPAKLMRSADVNGGRRKRRTG